MQTEYKAPWSFEVKYISVLRKLRTGTAILRDAAGEYIAEVPLTVAPLLAAAPRLLKELKGVYDAIEYGHKAIVDANNSGGDCFCCAAAQGVLIGGLFWLALAVYVANR